MKISTQDADLFFKLMWSLQNYVNLKLQFLPEITSVDEYENLPSPEKLDVREALYDNIELIDDYFKENPDGFSEEELEIVKGWKRFHRGDFFIERLLKKHAIFIGDDQVYAVLALYDPFEDVLPYGFLPYYARAVLLPFKGKIIYDGLLQGYAVSFGGGIKYDLKETYMAAKQNRRIIESLDPEIQAQKSAPKVVTIKNWGPALDDISRQAKKLRSSRGAPAIHSPAFSMVRASLAFAKLAVENPDDTDQLWKALEKVERAMSKTETVLHRSQYY